MELIESVIFEYMDLFIIENKYNYKRFCNSIGASASRLSSVKFTMYEVKKFVAYVDEQLGETQYGQIESVIDQELNYLINGQ